MLRLGSMTPAMFSVDMSILMNAFFTDSFTFVLCVAGGGGRYEKMLVSVGLILLESTGSPVCISELDEGLL